MANTIFNSSCGCVAPDDTQYGPLTQGLISAARTAKTPIINKYVKEAINNFELAISSIPTVDIRQLKIKMGTPSEEINSESGYDLEFDINVNSISSELLYGYEAINVLIGTSNSEPVPSGFLYYSEDPDESGNGRIDFLTNNNFDSNIYITLIKRT